MIGAADVLDTDPPPPCQHTDFSVDAAVTFLEDAGMHTVDLKIECSQCGEPFRWLGVRAGIDFERPTCSIDGLELRAPIQPESVMGKGALHQTATFRMPPTSGRTES